MPCKERNKKTVLPLRDLIKTTPMSNVIKLRSLYFEEFVSRKDGNAEGAETAESAE
jgi:hypothetical protein